MTTTANIGYTLLEEGQTDLRTPLNDMMARTDRWLARGVKSRTTTAQPGSPVEGDGYIIPYGATGAQWGGFNVNYVAIFLDGAWNAYAPVGRVRLYVDDEGLDVFWNGTAWTIPVAGNEFFDSLLRILDNTDPTSKLAFEVGDIATGTTRTITMPDRDVDLGEWIGRIYVETVADQEYVLDNDMPFPGTITTLRTKTASGTCTVTGEIEDVNLGGTANSASTTAEEQAHASANVYAKGDKVAVTVSGNSAATGLEIKFYGQRTG